MKIPEFFECAGHLISVEMHNSLKDNQYGIFYDAPGVIKLAKTLNVEDYGEVKVNDLQLSNTFWHEFFHCCQFFAGEPYSEEKVQVYANFMCEFFKTKEGEARVH